MNTSATDRDVQGLNSKSSGGIDALHAPTTDLKQKSVRGGTITIFGQAINMVLQIGTTVVLARLLLPSDYGLQAMVLTLTAFFSLFKDAGLSVATVQREKLTNEQISTLFWINVGIGALLTLLVSAAAPLLVSFYKDERLFWLTIVSSCIFFFHSLSVQHRALLDRSMRFTTSVKIDIFCGVASATVAVVLAFMKFGYWALICQNISIPIFTALAVWISVPWFPGKPHWTSELKSMIRFGSTVTLNSVVVYIAYNLEKVLLGKYWGTAPLGIYGRGYQLATLPVQQLINAVHTVAFAALARMQNDMDRLRSAYLKSLSLIVSITIPIALSTALFADEIVAILLGPRWQEVTPVLRLLSPTVMFLALANPFSWFLRATGMVKRSLNIAFLICPTVILGVIAGLHYGPRGVATGYSSAMVILFVPVVAWAIHGTGITANMYWNAIKRPLCSGFLAGLIGWGFRYFFSAALKPLPLLVLEFGVSFLVYVAVLLFVMGEKELYFDLIKQLLPQKRKEAVAG